MSRARSQPIHNTSIYSHAAPWPQPTHNTSIYRAEATGCDLALDITQSRNFTLVTDNKALYHAIRKGRSNDRHSNVLLQRIFRRRMGGGRVFVKWVPTDENPADLPSRVSLLCPGSVLVHQYRHRLGLTGSDRPAAANTQCVLSFGLLYLCQTS